MEFFSPMAMGVIAAVVIVLVYIYLWEKNRNAKLEAEVPESVKAELAILEVEPVPSKKWAWVQKAYIADMRESGAKAVLRVMLNNAELPGGGEVGNTFTTIRVSKEEAAAHGLAVGSFVRIMIEPEASPACTLVF